jgi:hypothetical protein
VSKVEVDWGADPAGSLTLTIDNVKMDPNLSGSNTELGIKGYYGPDHGRSADATARWGHTRNEWFGVLDAGAVIRLYEGVQGPLDDNQQRMSIADGLTGGYLMRAGVFMVDSWNTKTGDLVLTCRSLTGPLLVDTPLYAGLFPPALHPLEYFRWRYENFDVTAEALARASQIQVTAGDKRTVFVDSSVDRWYPSSAHGVGSGNPGDDLDTGGFVLHGHQGAHAVDSNPNTYWLSEGNSGPDKEFATVWIEFDCGEAIDAVHLHPWGGNYELYISVLEDGRWQGTAGQTVPYDYHPLEGHQPYVIDNGAAIPYVLKTGVAWETAGEHRLPRVYRAQRVRLTFRHLADSHIGQWRYRAGVREVRLRVSNGKGTVAGPATRIEPAFYAVDAIRDPDNYNRTGYLTGSIFHQFDAFGDARVLPRTGGDPPCSHELGSIALIPDGSGYWTLCDHGHVGCYGAAPNLGNEFAARNPLYGAYWPVLFKAGTIIPTHTGLGFWIISWDGAIYSHGDAPTYTDITPPGGEFIHGAGGYPSDYGFAAVATDGNVFVRGAATDHGDWTESTLTNAGQEDGRSEIAVDIAYTADGSGYWILSTGGRVQPRGTATDFGQITTPTDSHSSYDRYYHLLPAPDDSGYLLTKGDGHIVAFGDAQLFGAPVPGTQGQLRYDGSYRDYCLDEESEALTKRGWMRWDELKPEDQLLGFDPDTGTSCWQEIEHLHRFHRNGEMVRFKSGSLDALTTPNHRWLVRNTAGTWKWTTSDSMRGADLIQLCIPGGAPEPEVEVHDDDFVELVGWFWTEGWWCAPSGAATSQSKSVNADKYERIRACLERRYGPPGELRKGRYIEPTVVRDALVQLRAGVSPRKLAGSTGVSERTLRNWRTNPPPADAYVASWNERRAASNGVVTFALSERIAAELRMACTQAKELRPEFLMALSQRQRLLLIDVSILADGTRRKSSSSENWSRSLAQSHEGRIRAFEMLCVLAGQPCVVHRRKPGRWSGWNCQLLVKEQAGVARDSKRPGAASVTRVQYSGMVWCPTVRHGNFLARRHGSTYLTGNSDIVKDLLRWAGYVLWHELDSEGLPAVYGNIESTGAYNDERLPLEMFDKKPVIDPISQLAEIVNYRIGDDEDGAFFFTTKNIYNFGNFYLDGTWTPEIVEFDERWNLFDLTEKGTLAYDRSEIVISTEDPTDALDTTVTTRFVPPNVDRLRGMFRPLLWFNGAFTNAEEQRVMAELIAVQLYLRQRQVQLVGPSHPGINRNDQVRVYERATGSTWIYYLQSKHVTWDRKSGKAVMRCDAHWLGDDDLRAITVDRSATTTGRPATITISPFAKEILERRGITFDELDSGTITHFGPISEVDEGEGAGIP